MTSRDKRSPEAREYRKLYDTARWKRIRIDQLTLEPYCRMCKEEGKVRLATIVDHVIDHKGDIDLFYNGERQSLCKTHHDGVKQSQSHTGFRKGFDEGGVPLDKNHPWNQSDKPASGPPSF